MPLSDLNELSLPALFDALASQAQLDRWLALVRDEDIGPERLDLTAELAIGERDTMRATVRAREAGIVSGLPVIGPLVRAFDGVVRVEPLASDGEPVEAGRAVATLEGLARDVLMVERPLLNILGRLSGVATRTASFVAAVGAEWPARIYDTRKTTPGMRHLEKYAVRCGGGYCHRLGLHDAVLVKDNHLAALGDDPMWPLRVHEWTLEARRRFEGSVRFFEVEVDTIEQFTMLMAVPEGAIDAVLLDNMSPGEMRRAVLERDKRHPEWVLEASGGVTLETVERIAATMVDRISVGSLTHGAASLDFGLDAL
jgi:nicotinate-nucleotide pyrophosphorylase (carboxylating)